MNGYRTEIFELHDKPSGLCTSWKRQGYTFDGCIHWLVGSKQGSEMNRIWQELGAAQGRQMVDHDEFMRYRGPDMLTIARYRKATVPDFARRFSDPFLRQAFAATLGMEMPDFPLVGLMMTLGWMHNRDAGYPIGGSLEFARAIEKRYLDLGGVIHYKARVAKILVEDDKAVGVRLTDGSEHRADIVISAADGHATIFDMLEGRYVNDTIKGYYDTWPIFQPVVQVSLGVARDLSQEPHMIVYALEQPLTIAGAEHQMLSVKHYCYDPTMAPAGKSAVVVLFVSNHAYWKTLAEDRERYEAEKKDIAIKVIAWDIKTTRNCSASCTIRRSIAPRGRLVGIPRGPDKARGGTRRAQGPMLQHG